MDERSTVGGLPLAIINVGLPARGKTHSSMSLKRYFAWLGINSKIFNVSEYRRNFFGVLGPHNNLFEKDNEESQDVLTKVSKMCFKDLVSFLTTEGGQVAIFDASNLSKAIRKVLDDTLSQNKIEALFIGTSLFSLSLFFFLHSPILFFFLQIEYICNIESQVDENIIKVKINSPDVILSPSPVFYSFIIKFFFLIPST
ncbi:6-phosphofructo-2-kinase/fructose-2,6-bisphosphatase 3 [Smittium mucronatum]|uniref:6-phosphofructo-2-kinase/fructose-2, 6-bisphosphatase 3 n=1 Tax=Smittium mucronatum TaxID=133383 RepID=A0A1R0H4D5_9FUNG|nr:6-phosphofructo-2-kinase/fructose-2,6-bisphosphatase 3 [Smittium mucronatum]